MWRIVFVFIDLSNDFVWCFDGICPVCQLVGLPGEDDGARQCFGKQTKAMDFLLPAQLGRNKVTLFNCEKEVRPTGKGLGFIIIPMSATKTHLKSKWWNWFLAESWRPSKRVIHCGFSKMTKVHLTGELLLCLKGIFFLFSGLHVWSNISQSFDVDQSIPAFVPIAQCQPSFGSGDSLNSILGIFQWVVHCYSIII